LHRVIIRRGNNFCRSNRPGKKRQEKQKKIAAPFLRDVHRQGACPRHHTFSSKDNYRPADWIGEDQEHAIYHNLRPDRRINGLRGMAGTGKIRVVREAVAAYTKAKIQPLFCAPMAAAKDVLRKEGFEELTLVVCC
jgi:hypothetical protein